MLYFPPGLELIEVTWPDPQSFRRSLASALPSNAPQGNSTKVLMIPFFGVHHLDSVSLGAWMINGSALVGPARRLDGSFRLLSHDPHSTHLLSPSCGRTSQPNRCESRRSKWRGDRAAGKSASLISLSFTLTTNSTASHCGGFLIHFHHAGIFSLDILWNLSPRGNFTKTETYTL